MEKSHPRARCFKMEINRRLFFTAPRMLTMWLLCSLLKDRVGLAQADGNPMSSHLLNGSLGQSLALPVHIPWPDPLILTWDFRSSSTGRKFQICYKARNNPAECSDGFKERFRLNLTDYSLEIQTLMKSDQGWYEVNARSGQDVHVELMELRVYEPVSKPLMQVTSVTQGGICHINLSCSVKRGSNVTYSWWTGGEEVTGDEFHNVTDEGRRLKMFASSNSTSKAYNCTVRNPVSEDTDMIILEPHCEQGKKQEENKKQLHTGLIIAAIAIFTCGLLIMFCVRRKKKHFKLSEARNNEAASEPALYAEIRRSSNARDQQASSIPGNIRVNLLCTLSKASVSFS
ncbi:SLAM family member 9-like isoform X2 [Chiloscyllium punctatum]|uniref:SLAM family member 9-like isoform X2 n=1 Tax=Chiloscyllium punctatum TaxID=137246 RepID=UPI003B63FB24